MTREDFRLTRNDGVSIACYRWRAAGSPRGIVQIAHGMGEHALRYAHVAEFLTDAGFHVYANDHRGHGQTAPPGSLGDFGSGGWDGLVNDLFALTSDARARDPGIPTVLLGHSMGSFALQQYLLDHSRVIDAAVISGSVSVDRLTIDPTRPVDLAAFNQGIDNPRTPFDWLSRDPAVVDAYVADPLCGFGIDASSLLTMATSALRLIDPNEIARICSDLPIYILAGDHDPLNHGLEWLKPLAERYRAAGLVDVTEQYYAGGRHEMFNEINREQVLADLLRWLNLVVER